MSPFCVAGQVCSICLVYSVGLVCAVGLASVVGSVCAVCPI